MDHGNDVTRNVLNYDDDLKTWRVPFVMAMINCRVVRKSNVRVHAFFCTTFNTFLTNGHREGKLQFDQPKWRHLLER